MDAEKKATFKLPFGDDVDGKPEGVTHFAFGNIGPRGLQIDDAHVVQGIRHFLCTREVDHFGAVKVRTNWKHIPRHQHLSELFRSEASL